MYCWQLSWYYIYICKHLVSISSTLCKAAVYCNHSQWMLYQQSCTCTQSHSSCNGTANCTVGPWPWSIIILGQNAFNDNSVKKTTFSVSHAIWNRDWIICLCNCSSTQVSDIYALVCTGYLQSILQYRMCIHTYMFQ